MKYNNLVFDASNLFWRSVVTSIKHNIDNKEDIVYTSSIQSAFNRIKSIQNQYGYDNSIIYLCFDNPESVINLRKLISHGEYKHSRESKNLPPQLYQTLDIFEELCKKYSSNFRVVKSKELEADDLTIVLSRTLKEDSILYVSADMDWARNIKDNHHWFNFSTLYTKDNFKNKYGFSPIGSSIQIYKSIRGDKSDCIENSVPRLPEKYLLYIIEHANNLEDIFKVSEELSEKWRDRILNSKHEIEKNYYLVDFINVELEYGDVVVECKENIEQLRKWYSLIDLPLETRMLKKKDEFFKVKRHKRLKTKV